MNWDQIQGQWDQVKGQVRAKWAKLTDDDLQLIGGKKDVFVGKLRERYGLEKDRAEADVDQFLADFDSSKMARH
jgi:uncharacterized protein YjbJ (UPF0337 family)